MSPISLALGRDQFGFENLRTCSSTFSLFLLARKRGTSSNNSKPVTGDLPNSPQCMALGHSSWDWFLIPSTRIFGASHHMIAPAALEGRVTNLFEAWRGCDGSRCRNEAFSKMRKLTLMWGELGLGVSGSN